MLRRKGSTVQIGGRMMKAGELHGRAWEIIDIKVAVDGLLHARLESCAARKDTILISADVLSDPQFWTQLPGIGSVDETTAPQRPVLDANLTAAKRVLT